MTLIYIILILLIVFAGLWYFAPDGWMTNIKTTMLGFWAASPAFIDALTNDVDWHAIFRDPQTVAIVSGVLVIMGILARLRSKIRGG